MELSYESVRPSAGIAVDASHLSSKNVTEYQGIDIATGDQVLYHNLGRDKTVNIGEFLAIVHAVQYIIENDFRPRIIYSDSITAITWFNNRETASSKGVPALKKAEIFLKVMEHDLKTIEVRHWNNQVYGETPADFGRK